MNVSHQIQSRSASSRRLSPFNIPVITSLMLTAGALASSAADVTLNASDAGGTSSFNSAGHWNNGSAPTGGNDYFTANFLLRSPANGSDYTFAGGSLSVDSGGRFLMKGTGGQTMTVENLIMNGGLADYANVNTDYNTETLAGSITLKAGTTSYFGALSGSSGSETLIITAPIGGSGHLQIAGPSVNGGADNGTVIFAGTNTYTGDTTVAGGTLALAGGGSIASPNISIAAGATLDVSGQTPPTLAAGQTLLGSGSVSGSLTTAATSTIHPGADGTAGTLTFNDGLTLTSGSTFNMDVSASSGSGNDAVNVIGALTLNDTTFNIRALSGASNLDTNVDYVLAAAGSLSGSADSTVTWVGTPPANATNYSLVATATQVKLHFNSPALSAVGVGSPSTVITNQFTLLTVTVRPGAYPTSSGIAVAANLTPIGGSPSQTFYDDGTHGDETAGDNVFSFSAPVASITSPGLNTLTASVTDAQGRSTTASIALTVLTDDYLLAPFLPVSETAGAGSLPLVAGGLAAPIYYSPNDALVVGIAAKALRDDVQRVTGLAPTLSSNAPAATSNAVFIGTVGTSVLIDGLVSAGKIDVSAIQGQWESYTTALVTNPIAGVDRALVIAGSDRRGTAYGIFGLSEAMGVSPWYWFGDVPVTQKSALHVGDGVYTEPSPGVKYRGIFINDEDWGMEPWARLTFDPAGDIGPTTYAKVFELLLRLHANYIWPAMHTTTEPFYTIAGNKEVADNYAIVMGTTHHEPMLRNTLEYDEAALGPYNYWVNRTNVYDFWEQRVIETGDYENIYTVGMRGLWDDGMEAPGGTTIAQKKDMLQDFVVPDQRQMLADHVNSNPAEVPQIFVPYKEALLQYQAGLQLPEDVTLVWPDDNHGYIRQLSTTVENARSGGSGVYYHLSYWGVPASYLWLCTTPPGMTWSEMSKAWDYNAKKLWLVNVGDLKPIEIGAEFFLRMARNPEAFRGFDQHAYLKQWAAKTFGSANAEAIATVLDEYYRLNIIVRPEHLNKTTSGFSFVANGDEAEQRLNEFATLTADADALYAQLPAAQQAAFYEMILYPIRGSKLVNEKVLLAERSRLWATQGRAATANLAATAQAAQTELQAETTYYNQTNAGGKWDRMMTWTTSGAASAPFTMPTTGSYTAPPAAGLGVAVEGSVAVLGATNPGVLPTFNPVANKSYFIDVFNTGTSALSWTAQSSAPWISLSQTNGNTDARIRVGIEWAQAPHGEAVPGTVTLQGAGTTRTVNLKAFHPLSLNLATLPNAVENNGVVTIEAEDFTTRHDSPGGVGWRRIARATASYDGMTILPTTATSLDPASISGDTPSLTYQFYTFNTGPTVIQMACLPTHFINSEHPGCRYAISLNGDTPQIVDISALEYSSAWNVNVLRATAHGTTPHTITSAGLQTVEVWMVDPGVVLDKLTVDLQVGPRYEAEYLDFSASGPYHAFTESAASGGGAVSLDATGVGQYITFVVPNLPPGVFDLTVRAKTWDSRGMAQVTMGDTVGGPFTNIGGVLDFYSASAIYTDLATIRITNSTAGTKYFKFTVTGKNPSSSGYWIVLDSLTFTQLSAPANPVAITTNLSGNTLNLTWPSGQGWRLQIQTNSLSAGLGNDWVSVTDGTVSGTNDLVDPDQPTVFYRLIYP